MKQWILGMAFVALACGSDQPISDDAEAADPFQEQLTLWDDGVEMFYHHSPLVAGVEGQSWAVHVTDLETFAPASEGTVRMQFLGPDGADFETVVTAPDRDGLFTPEPVFPVGGAYDLTVSIQRAGRVHEVYVGPVIVYGTQADVPDLQAEEPVGIAFLKEQQWAIPFATVEATRRHIPSSVYVTGEIVPAAGRMAAVAAPVEGIIGAEAGRDAPVPGQWVNQGDVLTVLSPTSHDDGYAQLRARAERLRREVERDKRLLAVEAIPARRLEEAQHDLSVVRASLDALGAAEDADYEFDLRAPISGYVDERHAVAGARAAAGDPLFTIVDTRVVWTRLDLSAADAGAALRTTGATLSVEGTDRAYRASRIISVGRVIDPTRRTLPVLAELDNTDQSLKVGMLASGRLLLGDPISGVAIPAAAVREEDGLFVAYVQIGGEAFERRALTLGPGDGEWTIVESGVRSGERVVTLGAYQVKLASLNTSAISDHGHPH